MFELLNILKNCNDDDYQDIKNNIHKYYDLLDFVQETISDKNYIVGKRCLINMMCYLGLEKSKHARADDIGKYVVSKSLLLKRRELNYNSGKLKLEITSYNYLRTVIKKLKNDIKQTSQYKLLKNVLIFLNHNDIYWFINLITKDYSMNQKVYDLIKFKKMVME